MADPTGPQVKAAYDANQNAAMLWSAAGVQAYNVSDGYAYMGKDFELPDTPSAPHGAAAPGATPSSQDIPLNQIVPTLGVPQRTAAALFPIVKAQNQFFKLDETQRKEWKKLVSAYTGNDASDSNQKTVWDQMVNVSASFQKTTGELISPFQLLQQFTSNANAIDNSNGAIVNRTDTSTTMTSDSAARGYLQDAYQRYVGREASPEEIAAFQEALAGAAKENPTTTVQSTTQGKQKQGANKMSQTDQQTSTQTSGGYDAQQLAQEAAKANPQAAEYQASTRFLNVFMNAIRNPVTG